MKSLILASGFGTRLYPLTVTKSKVLLPFKGRPIISHVVDRIPQGIDILVNINKKFEADFLKWQHIDQRRCVSDFLAGEPESAGECHAKYRGNQERAFYLTFHVLNPISLVFSMARQK